MRLPRDYSMTSHEEFARVKSTGKSAAGRFLVLATLEDARLSGPKIAFVMPKKIGNAVARNRAKRRLRGIVSRHGERMRWPRYLVMIGRWRVNQASFAELENDWLRLARKLGIERKEAN